MFKTNGKMLCCSREVVPQWTHQESTILTVWNCPKCGKLRQEVFPKVFIGEPTAHGSKRAEGNPAVLRGHTKRYLQSTQVEA